MVEAKAIRNKKIILIILEIIVLTAVACLTISEFGGYYLIITTIGKHSRLLKKIAFTLFLVKVMMTRYTKKEFVYVIALSLLGYINYSKSGNDEMLMSILMVLSLKNVNLKKVCAVCLAGIICTVSVLGVLSVAGITGDVSMTENFGRGAMETRYCFGFHHPNQWAHAMFMILLCYILAFWERIEWKRIILLFAVNLAVYKFAASRTAFICGMVLIIMSVFYKYMKKAGENRVLNYLISAGCVSVWFFSLYVVNFTQGNFWDKLDRLFTGRISLAKEYVAIYKPTLWGEKIADTLDRGQVLDFGYIRFFLENGMIIYGLMILGTLLLGIYAVKKHRNDLMIMLVSLTLYGIYENVAMRCTPANMIMVFFALLLFHKELFLKNQQKML